VAAATNRKETAYLPLRTKKNGPYSPRTLRRKKRIFLKAYPETLAISAAAEAAGVDRGAHYTWLANDPEYAQAFADIEDRTLDLAEREVFSRGVVGWDEPVFHQGEICGHIRRKDTTCLIFWLKCRGKGRWNDRIAIDGLSELANALGALTMEIVRPPAQTLEHQEAKQVEAAQEESTGAQE
jgi:hypothetical protein